MATLKLNKAPSVTYRIGILSSEITWPAKAKTSADFFRALLLR